MLAGTVSKYLSAGMLAAAAATLARIRRRSSRHRPCVSPPKRLAACNRHLISTLSLVRHFLANNVAKAHRHPAMSSESAGCPLDGR